MSHDCSADNILVVTKLGGYNLLLKVTHIRTDLIWEVWSSSKLEHMKIKVSQDHSFQMKHFQ